MNDCADGSDLRDYRIDFIRGAALLIVYSDHVVGNMLHSVTPGRWGPSDMAEVFVFLSGYVCGRSYYRKLKQSGLAACQRKAGHRALQLYIAACAMQLVTALTVVLQRDGLHDHVADCEIIWQSSLNILGGRLADILLLKHVGFNFAILLQYLVFLPALPLILCGLRRWSTAVMSGSLLTYALVQLSPDWVSLPQPWRDNWFFNPLAWQLLFYSAAAFAAFRTDHSVREPNDIVTVTIAAIFLELTFLITVYLPPHSIPFVDKSILAPFRVFHFICILIVGRALVPSSEFFRGARLATPVVRCGQNPLVTYCVGGLLAIVGTRVLTFNKERVEQHLIVNVAGWLGCIAAAYLWHFMRRKTSTCSTT